jgi:protein Mpv17
MEFVRWYNRLLYRYPKSTEIVSSFILTYASDCICQYIEKPSHISYFSYFNAQRSWNLSIFGAGIITPMFHYWYKFLAFRFPRNDFWFICVKSLADRLTIGSFVVLSFFVSQHYMNGGNTPDLKVKLERDLPGALKMNVTVWMSALILNFKYVPLEFQVLFLNTVGFFWMIYLTWAMNRAKDSIKQ